MKNNTHPATKQRTSLWLSIGCVFCLFLLCLNALCFAVALRGGVYTQNPESFTKTILTNALENESFSFYEICDSYEAVHFPKTESEQTDASAERNRATLAAMLDTYSAASTNLCYRIKRENTEILSNAKANETALVSITTSYQIQTQKHEQIGYASEAERDEAFRRYQQSNTVVDYSFDTTQQWEGDTEKTVYLLDIWCLDSDPASSYEITLFLCNWITSSGVRDYYSFLVFVLNAFVALRLIYPILSALSLLVLLGLFFALLCIRTEKIRPIDRIPYLFLLMLYLLCVALLALVNTSWSDGSFLSAALHACLGTALFGMTLWLILRTVRRIRLGIFGRTTLFYHCLRLLRFLCMHIPALYKLLLGSAVFLALQGLSILLMRHENAVAGALLWVLLQSGWLGFTVYCVLCWNRIQEIGKAAASGEAADIPRWLLPEFQKHAVVLFDNAERIAQAVNTATKSERMKAELITNVSHDIKTPLTSIVNYTDLLQKEGVQSPNAPEYLSVLQRQSIRLKKLTEDLIEASRASSGTVAVHAQTLDLCVMLLQELGEYKERLEGAGLTVLETGTEAPAPILADPALLGRIFDNLFGNICKYAMPGTRVYLSLERSKTHATLILRNIAKEPLSGRGDELLERFVRGDHARTTQGSGLGLSIAQSLTALQNGTLQLKIDGDLFKVILCFPLQGETQPE